MIKEFENAKQLPNEWDGFADGNVYLKRDFLCFLESVSEFPMRFFGIFEGQRLDSIFVTFFKRKHNIGMFSKKDFFVPVTLFYIPLSISKPAVVLGNAKAEFDEFFGRTKGCKLILNVDEDFRISGFAHGYTCPQCILDLKWKTFEDYLGAMRSDYRYRYTRAFKKSKELELERLENNNAFNDAMYAQYLEVFGNSRFQIERLTPEFFRGERFVLLTLKNAEGRVLGFVQLLPCQKELVFEFVGFDHAQNRQYDLYIRLLLEIVRYGIQNGFETIDFGQTADEAKLKLGCRYKHLYAVIGHSNFLMNAIIKNRVKKLEYNFIKQQFHIFKEERE